MRKVGGCGRIRDSIGFITSDESGFVYSLSLSEVDGRGGVVDGCVVQAFDTGEDKGMHFLWMEYVEGIGLNELIREQGCVPPTLAADSPLATAGSGKDGLAAYVGAVPPEAVEEWDWSKLWQSLSEQGGLGRSPQIHCR